MIDQYTIIWRVKLVSCDGNVIGRTWNECFFLQEDKALEFLSDKVKSHNEKEFNRDDPFIKLELAKCKDKSKWSRLYLEDIVDGINGYCCWAYSKMLLLDKISITNDI